jgi:hypothetical protein
LAELEVLRKQFTALQHSEKGEVRRIAKRELQQSEKGEVRRIAKRERGPSEGELSMSVGLAFFISLIEVWRW